MKTDTVCSIKAALNSLKLTNCPKPQTSDKLKGFEEQPHCSGDRRLLMTLSQEHRNNNAPAGGSDVHEVRNTGEHNNKHRRAQEKGGLAENTKTT